MARRAGSAQLRQMMSLRASLLLAVTLAIPAAACAPSSEAPADPAPADAGTFPRRAEKDLPTHGGATCRAYVAWGHEPVTDVFLWMGGTGTGSLAFLPDVAQELIQSRSAAFITFDKPGIRAPFGDPNSATTDDGTFQRHTQGSNLECASQALLLSTVMFGADTRWHFRGHSEGSLISLFLLEKLLADQPEEADRVGSLVLSGVPIESFEQIVRRQLADKPILAAAVERCDWPVMKKQLGLSCEYLQDAYARPSGLAMFEKLATRRTKVPFRIFHGNADENTPAVFVRQLEVWNRDQGHLDLTIRFYEGGHSGTPEVRREMTDVLLGLVPH